MMGDLFSPKDRKPVLPPKRRGPDEAQLAAATAARRERERLRGQRGRASTILAGLGDGGPAPSVRATLGGG